METALRRKLPTGRFENVLPARSRAMAAVRGKGNVTTERRMRFALVREGITGWKLNPTNITGRPDFFFAKARLAVFVDGCFWHGCKRCGHIPSKNNGFWKAKIDRNRQRDKRTTKILTASGVQVLRFWEHQLQSDIRACVRKLRQSL